MKRYQIQQCSAKDLQINDSSHQSPQARHQEGLADFPRHPLTKGEEGLRHNLRIPTSDGHRVHLMGQEDQASRRVEVGPPQETTVADLHHSIRPKTPRLCLPYDSSHLWNKVFAHDLVARV